MTEVSRNGIKNTLDYLFLYAATSVSTLSPAETMEAAMENIDDAVEMLIISGFKPEPQIMVEFPPREHSPSISPSASYIVETAKDSKKTANTGFRIWDTIGTDARKSLRSLYNVTTKTPGPKKSSYSKINKSAVETLINDDDQFGYSSQYEDVVDPHAIRRSMNSRQKEKKGYDDGLNYDQKINRIVASYGISPRRALRKLVNHIPEWKVPTDYSGLGQAILEKIADQRRSDDITAERMDILDELSDLVSGFFHSTERNPVDRKALYLEKLESIARYDGEKNPQKAFAKMAKYASNNLRTDSEYAEAKRHLLATIAGNIASETRGNSYTELYSLVENHFGNTSIGAGQPSKNGNGKPEAFFRRPQPNGHYNGRAHSGNNHTSRLIEVPSSLTLTVERDAIFGSRIYFR